MAKIEFMKKHPELTPTKEELIIKWLTKYPRTKYTDLAEKLETTTSFIHKVASGARDRGQLPPLEKMRSDIKIIKTLASSGEQLDLQQISAKTELAKVTVQQQLTILLTENFVERTRRGRKGYYYKLTEEGEKFWKEREEEAKNEVKI